MTTIYIDEVALHDANTSPTRKTPAGDRHAVVMGPAPCELDCQHYQRCRSTGEECQQLRHWYSTNKIDERKSREPDQGEPEPEQDPEPGLTGRSLPRTKGNSVRLNEALSHWPPMNRSARARKLGITPTTQYRYESHQSEPSDALVHAAWKIAKEPKDD